MEAHEFAVNYRRPLSLEFFRDAVQACPKKSLGAQLFGSTLVLKHGRRDRSWSPTLPQRVGKYQY